MIRLEDEARAQNWLIACNHHACHLPLDPNDGLEVSGTVPLPDDVEDLAAQFAEVRAPLEARIAELEATLVDRGSTAQRAGR